MDGSKMSSDTIILRDHDEPCGHPQAFLTTDDVIDAKVWWDCYVCPGGRERTFRVVATPEEFWGEGEVWVEVTDER